jgi:hypothetical protein
LKDPWKLLVAALVLANVVAAGAVVMMLRNKKAAEVALNEAKIMLQAPTATDRGRAAAIYKEVKKIAAVHAITRESKLRSTSETDVRRYIHNWATEANLPRKSRNISYKAITPRPGVKDHTWTLSFTDRDANISRSDLAFFLFKIKVLTPQLKIRTIKSGPTTEDFEKADHWRPEVEFVLTKEESDEE